MFNVNINVENTKIVGALVVDSYFFEPSKYDYAFYLYKNNEKVDAVGYSENMTVAFNVDEPIGTFAIKAYIRDKDIGNKRSFFSEKLTIHAWCFNNQS